jgi:heme/copper-type cytochrome/quinol oxidase subunit 1
MILPAMGVVSELITCFARKKVFGYKFMAFSLLAIASVSFLVWGHHMFVSGQSAYAGMVFSALSFIVAIPSAIKVFNWTATLYKGSPSADSRDCSSPRWRSMCTFTIRISSSRISITSWSAAQ